MRNPRDVIFLAAATPPTLAVISDFSDGYLPVSVAPVSILPLNSML
jgi:hypothetical protein